MTPLSLLRRLSMRRAKTCASLDCNDLATHAFALIEPNGKRIDRRALCQACADKTAGMLIPTYLDGRPAFEVLPR